MKIERRLRLRKLNVCAWLIVLALVAACASMKTDSQPVLDPTAGSVSASNANHSGSSGAADAGAVTRKMVAAVSGGAGVNAADGGGRSSASAGMPANSASLSPAARTDLPWIVRGNLYATSGTRVAVISTAGAEIASVAVSGAESLIHLALGRTRA
jgi:hypothetical protein